MRPRPRPAFFRAALAGLRPLRSFIGVADRERLRVRRRRGVADLEPARRVPERERERDLVARDLDRERERDLVARDLERERRPRDRDRERDLVARDRERDLAPRDRDRLRRRLPERDRPLDRDRLRERDVDADLERELRLDRDRLREREGRGDWPSPILKFSSTTVLVSSF